MTVTPGSKPQYTEAAFRRYEPYIREIVENYPNPTKIEPRTIEATTFESRCRDALRAFMSSDWHSTLSKPKLRNIFFILGARGKDAFRFSLQGDTVYVGPFRRANPLEAEVGETTPITVSQSGEFDARDLELFRSFAYLKNLDVISGEVTFVNVTIEQERTIEEEFPNVLLERDGVKTLML